VQNSSKRRKTRPLQKEDFPTFESFSRLRTISDDLGQDILRSGTGTIVSPSGHLLTASHVVPKGSKVLVLFRKKLFEAKVLKRQEDQDALLLQIKPEKTEKFPYAKVVARDYKLGQPVFFLGYPIPDSLGIKPRFTASHINSDEGYCTDESRFTITADAVDGSSGSAVFNTTNGEVIGIVSASIFAAGRDADKFPSDICFCVKSQSFLNDFSQHLPPQKGIKHQKQDRQELIDLAAETSVLILAFSGT
jgi:S1-C subfamily serine protease